MSYVGKILVVIQVVMSILFMTFAGAVFAVHANLKGKHEVAQQQLTTNRQDLATAQEELEKSKTDLTAKLTVETERANQFQAQNLTLVAKEATLVDQNNRLEQQRDTEKGLAQAKAAEARFRQEEAEKQRIENAKIQVALDEVSREVRQLKDELISKKADYSDLLTKYNSLLEKSAYLEKVVAANSLPTDPRSVSRMSVPAPPVEGLVREVRKNKTNRVQFVELSIGSDDGLLISHVLDVIRVPTAAGAETEWLGKVKVVSVNPDSAVAEVILAAKNGIIQEGDNVTTKL